MPTFQIEKNKLSTIEEGNFDSEKKLQTLIESNLETVFGCRFVATEFPTGAHGGRIDTLALSEDCNPVIIEYKKVESSELINQSLFYLHWLQDHRGDFEIAARKKLGAKIEIDWSDARVICIAPNYRKYDLHAVQAMGANIEIWRYRLYKNSTLHIECVYRRSMQTASEPNGSGKNPIMVAAGKKAAQTRATGSYTFHQHVEGKPERIVALAKLIQNFILLLGDAVEESPKKFYVAYKVGRNFACMEIQKRQVLLYLTLSLADLKEQWPANARDVTDVGHFGTGNLELTIEKEAQLQESLHLVQMAYQHAGGA